MAVAGNWIGNGILSIPKKAPTVRAGFLPEEKMRELLEVVSDVRQTDGIIVGERDGKILALPRNKRGTTILPYMGHLAA